MEEHKSKSVEMSLFDFDLIIDSTYDMVSAVFLALSAYLNNHLPIININCTKAEYVPFSLLAMQISLPGCYCQSISDTGNTKQINVEINIENTDRTYILRVAVMLVTIMYNHYSGYEQYMINFHNERMATSWVCFKEQEIQEILVSPKSTNDVIKEVNNRNDCVIFDASTEPINLNDVKYFCFPNFGFDQYTINNISDASIGQRKRLKAHLFVGCIDKKDDLLEIINQAIEVLKFVKNPPSPTIPHKYGDVESDSLYINVYRFDTRESKELLPNNENFVCFVDYNLSGETTLLCGGLLKSVWNRLYHEKLEKISIAWREGKYATIVKKKIKVNEPCPCGSGKKFKKCCSGKGIYD